MNTRCNESIPLKILWINFQKKMFENFIVIFFRFLPCSLETRISSRPRWQTYGFKNEKEEEETGERACVDVDYEETVPELADERSSAIRIPVTLGLYTRLETCWALYEKPNAFINTNFVYYLQVVWCCVSVFKQSVPLLSIKGLTSSLQDYSLRHRSSQGKQTFIYVCN